MAALALAKTGLCGTHQREVTGILCRDRERIKGEWVRSGVGLAAGFSQQKDKKRLVEPV